MQSAPNAVTFVPAPPNKIYGLISKVMSEIGAIGKNGNNELDGYTFRKIDDVYNKLQPILAKHGVFFVPSVTESNEMKIDGENGAPMLRVSIAVKYRIFADDGSFVEATTRGEAIDLSDKATNKALTAAFKYLLIQIFCIAVEGIPDSDSASPKLSFTKEKNPPKAERPDFQITDGKYRGKWISHLDKNDLALYIKKIEGVAKANGRNHPKWFLDLKMATGL